jgi:hypothetical protein
METVNIRATLSLLTLAVVAALTTEQQQAMAAAGGDSALSVLNGNPSAPHIDEKALERARAKFAHALSIADQFAAQVKAAGLDEDNWRFKMVGNLMKGSEANFASVTFARSFTDAMGASVAVARAANNSTQGSSAAGSTAAIATPPVADSLGSGTTDLVYVPIVPCRILDTRAAGGGILAANSVHTYNFSGGNIGASSSCSVEGQIPASDYAAAFAANVTIDDSTISGFTAGAYLQIYPQGGSTPASFMNFGPGQIIANAGIVSLSSTSQFSVTTSAPANVIIDTYGAFLAPQPTPLSCVTETSTTASFGAASATCPTNYSLTGGGCSSSSIYDHVYASEPHASSEWYCGFYPETGQTIGSTLTAYAVCCVVPGRLSGL